MSILRQEGFVHFQSVSDWAAKGHNYSGANLSFSPTTGRDGRGCAIVGLNASLDCVMPIARQTTFHHVAVYNPVRSPTGTAFYEARNATVSHLVVRGLQDGSLEILRCSPTFSIFPFNLVGSVSIGVTVPNVWRAATWHELQIKTVIDSSSGAVVIRVDGIEVFNQTGLNTYAGGSFDTIQIGMGNNGGSADTQYSDFVTVDDQGVRYNSFLAPDVKVYESVSPTDGDELNWVRSSGAGTWASHVDENPQDGDTTYLRSPTDGQRVCFSFPTISAGIGTPLAVKETVCHRKEDAAYGVIQLYTRSDDDIDHDGSLKPSTQDYIFDEEIHETDPKDGAVWTTSRVNNTQLGFTNASGA
jgi:hypothetical protein